MKKYLIDTHILIWWLTDDSRLSKKVKSILEDPKNYVLASVVSFWEISIKLNKEKLLVNLEEIIRNTEFKTLSVKPKHTIILEDLPLIHKDPFDRMLVAQAISEECVLISADKKIEQYSDIIVIS